MKVQVRGNVGDLARDMADITVKAKREMAASVRSNALKGRDLARGFARESAGAHGKHYPSSITHERRTPLQWEYGPDSAMPQGGMSFEYGSRNQRAHLDLNRSADIIGPAFARDVIGQIDRLFW